jgi:hypothetical protein
MEIFLDVHPEKPSVWLIYLDGIENGLAEIAVLLQRSLGHKLETEPVVQFASGSLEI